MSVLRFPSDPWDEECVDLCDLRCLIPSETSMEIASDQPSSFMITEIRSIYSGNSKVFRGSLVRNGQGPRDVVCKLAIGKRRIGRLSAEAGFYTKELKDLQGDSVPRFHGYFEGETDDGRTGCLVLDYIGETLDHLLFSMNFEFRYAVMKAIMSVHFAGVEQCDFEERNIVIDENGRPFIIDFDNAMEHECKLAIPIVFNEKQPSYSKLKCLELYSAGKMAQAWTPGRVYYMMNYIPIKYATSPETLMKKAPKGVSREEAYIAAVRTLDKLARWHEQRRELDSLTVPGDYVKLISF